MTVSKTTYNGACAKVDAFYGECETLTIGDVTTFHKGETTVAIYDENTGTEYFFEKPSRGMQSPKHTNDHDYEGAILSRQDSWGIND